MSNSPSTNLLSPTWFKFNISKLPNVNFLVQATEIPEVSMKNAEMPTPFVTIPIPGDHLLYSPLSIVFKVDENLTNYIELYDWLKGLGFPENFDQAKTVYKHSTKNLMVDGATSTGTLTILNSDMSSVAVVTFYDLFPVGISRISFDSRNTDIKYIDATATFMYRSFDIKSTNSSVWA